jgi:glycine reductase
VLIQGCHSDSHAAHSAISYYGLSIRDSLATFVHPNEMLDGAIGVNTTKAVCHHPTTWDWQNHPLVLGLFRENNRRVNFAGVILERIRFETHHGKEVIAHNTAQMGNALRADGALVTWVGGGNAFIDVMLTIQACEQRGIKTVLVGYESGVKSGVDAPLLYYVPEADAVVSTGNRNSPIELPEAERVAGAYEEIQILNYPGAPVVPARGPVKLDALDMIVGGADIWGMQSWTCRAY